MRAQARGPRPTPRRLLAQVADALPAVALGLVAPLLRPWHSRWGATGEEVEAAMPGDELVPGCSVRWTRAVTVRATPDAVWPWLVQAGFGGAGFYSVNLLDNAGRPSARRVIPELQHLSVGDWVPMFTRVDERTAFRVRSFAPSAWLLWAKPDSTWAWTLAPLPGGRTRLVTRLRQRHDWSHPAGALVSVLLIELGDFPMMRRMLLGIARRAEGRAG